MKGHLEPAPSGSFVCPACWQLFAGDLRACPDCASTRPAAGWPSMPCAFRGRYLLIEQIDRDALTASFRAENREEGASHRVIIKVARQKSPRGALPSIAKLLRREATMAGLLGDETDAFFGLASADLGDPPYLAFEHVDWPTLRDLLAERGTLDPLAAARIGVAILHGLTALERHDLVHRALTPSRIFVLRGEDGLRYDVKIAGFGVSADGEGEPTTLDPAALPYSSPEQLRGEELDSSSDVYMVAAILWELSTGQPPHPLLEKAGPNKAAAHRLRSLERVPSRPADMPAELHALLARALAFDSDERCPDDAPDGSPSAALGSALERFAEEHPERQARELAGAREELTKAELMLSALNERLAPIQENHPQSKGRARDHGAAARRRLERARGGARGGAGGRGGAWVAGDRHRRAPLLERARLRAPAGRASPGADRRPGFRSRSGSERRGVHPDSQAAPGSVEIGGARARVAPAGLARQRRDPRGRREALALRGRRDRSSSAAADRDRLPLEQGHEGAGPREPVGHALRSRGVGPVATSDHTTLLRVDRAAGSLGSTRGIRLRTADRELGAERRPPVPSRRRPDRGPKQRLQTTSRATLRRKTTHRLRTNKPLRETMALRRPALPRCVDRYLEYALKRSHHHGRSTR